MNLLSFLLFAYPALVLILGLSSYHNFRRMKVENADLQMQVRVYKREAVAHWSALNQALQFQEELYRRIAVRDVLLKRFIENLEYWLPDESMVTPDEEPDQWYQSINVIFETKQMFANKEMED